MSAQRKKNNDLALNKDRQSNKLPLLIPHDGFNANKSLWKEFSARFNVVDTTLPDIDTIDPNDLYMTAFYKDHLLTVFVSKASGINPDINRHALNVLLMLASFARPQQVLLGTGNNKPTPRGICKNTIHLIMPYYSNKRLTENLNILLSKQLISHWKEQGSLGRSREVYKLTLSGHFMVSHFNKFYTKNLQSVFVSGDQKT